MFNESYNFLLQHDTALKCDDLTEEDINLTDLKKFNISYKEIMDFIETIDCFSLDLEIKITILFFISFSLDLTMKKTWVNSTRTKTMAVLANYASKVEAIKLTRYEDVFNVQTLEKTTGTHVLTAMTWGAQANVLATFTTKTEKEMMEVGVA